MEGAGQSLPPAKRVRIQSAVSLSKPLDPSISISTTSSTIDGDTDPTTTLTLAELCCSNRNGRTRREQAENDQRYVVPALQKQLLRTGPSTNKTRTSIADATAVARAATAAVEAAKRCVLYMINTG
jgi:hypothetical protein